MAPPQYADLGKAAKDLFDKGYNYGFAKVELKTKAASGMELTTKGSSANDTGKISGVLETRYSRPKYGLTMTEKWTTDNQLSTEVGIQDQIATGLRTTLCTSFSPNTGKKSGALKNCYLNDHVTANLDTDFELSGPMLQGAAVLGYDNWVAGYNFGFDTAKSSLTKNNLAIGYSNNDVQTLIKVNDGSEFTGSLYQKVNADLSIACSIAWRAGENNTNFAVASKLNLNGGESSISTKLGNNGMIGCSYSHALKPGVKITLSSLVDGKNLNNGGHKMGVGLEFQV